MALLIIPAMTLYTAVKFTRWVNKLTRGPDLSYGIYVFAFPVQQIVVNYLHPPNPAAIFFLTVLLALPPALISWYVVETTALKFKKLVVKNDKRPPIGSLSK
jgi:peptidoglycan/LPS O-acetylase OafA/YrhL